MIGREISHYRIIERLGSGGMGVVYKAQDHTLGRYVALKFLPAPVTSNSEVLDRFLREARAAAALNHPNICTIYEVSGNPPDPYIAMEYLEGKTLRERISGHALPQDLMIELATQLADALSAAHERRIIHRDIKPANIFVTRGDQAKILDFGLAKITQARSFEDQTTFAGGSALTNPGTTVGTASYMSPEQARGEELDNRSDIFSLGAVLYEMASGKVAFDGNTPAIIYNAILSHAPATLNQLNPDLSPELIRIINRCLEKNRELRYQNAADLRSELRRLKRDSDVHSASVIVQDYAAPRRSSVKRVAFVAAFAASIAAITAVLWPHFFATAEKMTETDVIVLTDFTNNAGDPVFDGTLKQALAIKLAESPFINVFSDQQMREAVAFMRRAPDEKITSDLGREICQRQNLKAMMNGEIAALGSQYVLTLTALNCDSGDVIARDQVQATSKEDVLRALGDAAMHMREQLGESLRSIQRMNAPIDQATTSSLEALKAFTAAEAQRNKGLDQEAIPLYKRAVELDPMFTIAYTRLGVILNNRGERTEAIELLKKGYDLRERVSERERLYVTAHYHRVVENDTEKAIATYKVWRQTYPRDYIPAINLGNIYLNSGRQKEAVTQLEEAIQFFPSPVAFSNLVGAYASLGETDKMLATYKVWAEKLPLDGNPQGFMSGYLRSTGKYEESLAAAQKALELEPTSNFYPPAVRGFIDLDRYDEARALAEKAVAEKRDSPDLHYYIYFLARLRGDKETMSREAAWWKGKPFEGFYHGMEGLYFAEDGKMRQAKALLDRAIEMGKKTGNSGLVERFLTADAAIHAVFGNRQKAVDSVRKTLQASRSRGVLTNAAITFSLVGEEADAAPIIKELIAKYPNDVHQRKVTLPIAQAMLALAKKQPEDALNLLKDTAPYEEINVYFVRGLAQAQAGRHPQAIAEFSKVIERPGLAMTTNALLYRLVHLEIARSSIAAGDNAKGRAAYEKVLNFFSGADPDLPVINEARAEFAKLPRS